MGKPNRGQKRKATYYKQHGAKKSKVWSKLDAGMRGVLITCNKREKEAIREAYNLLNEYADKLYGPENTVDGEQGQSGDEEDEEDIEAALKKEVASLKEVKPAQRRFQQVDTGTNNVLFVKTTLDNPTELVRAIFSDCLETQQSKSRFILRMLPVLGTCQAYDDRITKMTEEVLEPILNHGQPTSYSLQIKVRNNNGVSRTSLLPVLGRVVEELNPSASVNFSDPEHIINVDVLKTVFCIGCLNDFNKFRKYNLQEIIESTKTVNKKKDGDGKVTVVEGQEEKSEGVKEEDVDKEKPEGVKEEDVDKEKPEGVKEEDVDEEKPEGVKEEDVNKERPEGVKEEDVDEEKPEGVKEEDVDKERPEGVKEEDVDEERPEGVKEKDVDKDNSDIQKASTGSQDHNADKDSVKVENTDAEVHNPKPELTEGEGENTKDTTDNQEKTDLGVQNSDGSVDTDNNPCPNKQNSDPSPDVKSEDKLSVQTGCAGDQDQAGISENNDL